MDAGQAQAAMLPLGGAWSGICLAAPADPWQPDSADRERRCNLGYARGSCPRFPDASGPDAIRFTITRDEGAVLRLYYVVERDHHPYAHGALDYARDSAAITCASAGPGTPSLLATQACAYAASYLRRKSEAAAVPAAST